MALRANRFRSHPELVAERSGESFVGTVAEIESDGQDVRAAVRKHARRLAQSPTAHVAHRGLASRPREHMGEMVARYPSNLRQFVERHFASEPALQKPQRFLNAFHASSQRSIRTTYQRRSTPA